MYNQSIYLFTINKVSQSKKTMRLKNIIIPALVLHWHHDSSKVKTKSTLYGKSTRHRTLAGWTEQMTHPYYYENIFTNSNNIINSCLWPRIPLLFYFVTAYPDTSPRITRWKTFTNTDEWAHTRTRSSLKNNLNKTQL